MSVDLKLQFLVLEARRWIGINEQGSNKGQLVERWQKTIDGLAQNESWCMCFVQHQVIWTDIVFKDLFNDQDSNKLFRSEHCMTVWNKSIARKIQQPIVGSIAIWNHDGTPQGHTGIVSHVDLSAKKFLCIEGNTGPGDGIVREGDGVFEKSRSMDGAGKMKLLGFIVPWT